MLSGFITRDVKSSNAYLIACIVVVHNSKHKSKVEGGGGANFAWCLPVHCDASTRHI